jgi:hypothetical protein
MKTQIVRVVVMGGPPDGGKDLAMGHHPGLMPQEDGEDFIFLGGQAQGLAVEIDAQPADLEERGLLPPLSFARRMSGCLPQSRQKLADAEGFLQIVIRPEVERRDLLGLAVTGRKHDHRHVGKGAQIGQNLLAVAVGQAKVEKHRIGGDRRRQTQRLGPGQGGARGMVRAFQADALRLAATMRISSQDLLWQVGGGKPQDEARATAADGGAFGMDRAAHGLHEAATDRQPQSRAGLAPIRAAAAPELLEDALEIGGADAGAFVGDADLDHLAFDLCMDGDLALFGIAQRIVSRLKMTCARRS